MSGSSYANKFCWRAFVLLLSCVACICLVSCAPANSESPETMRTLTNYANFPYTLSLKGLAVDYPEGFAASKGSDTTLIIEDVRYSGRRQTIANADYSIFFTVEVYTGIGLDDIERHFATQIKRLSEESIEPSEALPEFNIPEGFNQLFSMRDPELLSLNGSRALLVVIERTDVEGVSVCDYYISLSENSIGKVIVGYTDEEYRQNAALYDGVISSVRADGSSV